VLSPEAPYPMHSGGALRTASLIEYLRRRYEVELVVFAEEGRPAPEQATAVVTVPRHSRALPARLSRNLRRWLLNRPPLMDRFAGVGEQLRGALLGRYELAVIEHFWCAPYVDILEEHCARVVLDLHNVESVWLARAAAVEKGLARSAAERWARRSRRLERELLPRFDRVLVTSEEDARAVSIPSVIYPNAIPRVPVPDVQPSESVVFSGNLEYHPNVTAVRYFAREVWPILLRCRRGLEWRVVGRNDAQIRRILAGVERVQVTGPVEDSLNAIAHSRVAVVPLLSGSGTRFKIIEAWCAGVPVVSTPTGAEGLPACDGENVLIAGDAKAFAAAVCRLLDDRDLAARLRTNGRALFEREFTWQAAWRRLDAADL
jgi:glycosyltransferase involved in cell wall biosynthesis